MSDLLAADDFSPALRPSAHPQASPGYGKRCAPGQSPRRKGDFTDLPAREAYLASYIDRLPEGAAIDVKTLAKEQPLYGQQAVRSALRELSRVGHLRRFKENVGEGCTRWVWHTYFSRTARDDAWWERFEAGDVPDAEAGAEPVRESRASGRSAAYDVLASLGRTDPRMVLSAAECAALEADAAQWLARGVSADRLVRALTAGLPEAVHSPGGIVRSRLREKLPPEPAPEPATRAARRRVMACTECGSPGGSVSLPGGLCQVCRGLPAEVVHRRVEELREINGSRHRKGAGTTSIEVCPL
ncbi:hypothetical protein [Streptomyces altiplanensis]